MLATGAELERAIDGAETTRPVLRGESIEGLAHVEYARAVSLLSPTAQHDWEEYMEATGDDDASSLELRNALIDEHEPMLEALALGARHTDAHSPIVWDRGYGNKLPKLMTARNVVNIAVLSARRHLDEGRHDRAVDVLLDSMQFSRDVMHGPTLIQTMIGCALLEISSSAVLLDGQFLERFPPTQLERLALGMQTLDSALSLGSLGADGDTALLIRALASADDLDETLYLDPEMVLGSWRYGFSKRLMCAEYVREAMRWRSFQTETQGLEWPELRQRIEALIADCEEGSNPLGPQNSRIQLSVAQAPRGALARFRMARTAIDYRLTGEVTALPDPFGTQLQVSESENGLRVESLGPGDQGQRERYTIEIARAGD